MSRVGRKPIEIPERVEVKVEKFLLTAKGPKGERKVGLTKGITIEQKEKELVIESSRSKARWGLIRALIAAAITDVKDGMEKRLEVQGVGYRASVSGKKLVLELGFSHPIEYEAPEGIEFKVEKNIIIVSGVDRQQVGQVAAEIRAFRKPEPYKGKGIRYEGEYVRRKAGKKAVATAE